MTSNNYNLSIHFDDNPDGIFYAGMTVKGHLEFVVLSPVFKLRGLALTIKGSAICNYSGDLSAEQEYFCLEKDLVGFKGAEPTEVTAGTYKYDFEYRMPRNIPYTTSGIYGAVRYFVMAQLDIPWELIEKKVIRDFTVQRYEDLNYMSGMREEREVRTVKDIDTPAWIFWKAASGHLSVRARIPQCGYASGEEIKVDVELHNKSTVDIDSVNISLQNVGLYVCQTPWARLEKTTNLTVSEISAQGVKAGYTAKIKESIRVPDSIPITSVMFCNVYQITYNVLVSIKFRRWNSELNLNIPVYIGSVALKHEQEVDVDRIAPMWPPSLKIKDIEDAEQSAENETKTEVPIKETSD